jgi:hypothetical protein
MQILMDWRKGKRLVNGSRVVIRFFRHFPGDCSSNYTQSAKFTGASLFALLARLAISFPWPSVTFAVM